MIIALDGPASSGKSTTAKLLGEKIGFLYIDTGAMYRAMTVKAKRNNINYTDDSGIISLLDSTEITQQIDPETGLTKTFLNNDDVSEEIRTPEISKGVSSVCAIPAVRRKLVELQRKMGQGQNVILDGRDIGTVVFPDADYKFYFDADLDIRAQRRYKEMKEKGIEITFEEIRNDIARRDKQDSEREDSPLKPAADAIHIDTSKLSIEEQIEEIYKVIKAKL